MVKILKKKVIFKNKKTKKTKTKSKIKTFVKKVIKNKINKIKKKVLKEKKIKRIKKNKLIPKKTKKVKKTRKIKVIKKFKKTVKKSNFSKKKKLVKISKNKSKELIKRKKKKEKVISLIRENKNPILAPSIYAWESDAVLNPAVLYLGGRVHLFYRAMGNDGISRIGYASSKDGIHFTERFYYPVFFSANVENMKKHWPYTSPARPVYDIDLYASGGGWGGCEDPRAVVIDGTVYMTFNMFNGWHSMRVAVVSIKEKDLLEKKWNWIDFAYLSRPGDRQKNWVLFPEKINGKFVVLHNIDMGDPNKVGLTYADFLDWTQMPYGKLAPDPQQIPDHNIAWHNRTRSASAPPIKTKDGWLVFYHAMSPGEHHRYKLGVLLLDLKDPSKVIARLSNPILEPDVWYENDYKPGIIYASGAVNINGKIFVYYGGGDKTINLATISLNELLESIKTGKMLKLKIKKVIK